MGSVPAAAHGQSFERPREAGGLCGSAAKPRQFLSQLWPSAALFGHPKPIYLCTYLCISHRAITTGS
jgi:hypothetical protein